MGWMMLRPRPITATEYHDWYLVGLSALKGTAELLVEHPDGRRVAIRLDGVAYLLGREFMEGNIIEHVTYHRIDAPETARLVLDELLGHGSEYFTGREAAHAETTGRLLGLTYVAVRPTYGAIVSIVAKSVTETEVGA